jgi:hypothetical protein
VAVISVVIDIFFSLMVHLAQSLLQAPS